MPLALISPKVLSPTRCGGSHLPEEAEELPALGDSAGTTAARNYGISGTNDFSHGLAVYVDAIKQIAAAPVCLPGRRCFACIRFGVYFLPGWFLRRYSSGLWPVKRRKLWEK